jgi:plasmid stabilization system protein ParE
VTDRIFFEHSAGRELDEAADFYDLERPGLGIEFVDAVYEALGDLLDYPESCPIHLGETRKLVLERFPYSILYWTDGATIAVSAVAHQRRRPGYWEDGA